MVCIILKFSLPNLYTIIIVAKIKVFLKKRKIKGFFLTIFMTMLSFKQVESNYGKREPCQWGCNWIIKFSHCLNFGYSKYSIIIFLIWTQNGSTCCMHEEKNLWSKSFWYFLKKSFFDVFSRRVSFLFKCGKAIFCWSRSSVISVTPTPYGDHDFRKLVT